MHLRLNRLWGQKGPRYWNNRRNRNSSKDRTVFSRSISQCSNTQSMESNYPTAERTLTIEPSRWLNLNNRSFSSSRIVRDCFPRMWMSDDVDTSPIGKYCLIRKESSSSLEASCWGHEWPSRIRDQNSQLLRFHLQLTRSKTTRSTRIVNQHSISILILSHSLSKKPILFFEIAKTFFWKVKSIFNSFFIFLRGNYLKIQIHLADHSISWNIPINRKWKQKRS